jgi:hypothetical protein
MKHVLIFAALIVFFTTHVDCYGADDSGSVKRMSTISRDGLMIIEFGVDSKHQVKDVIFREANNKNLTLEMVPDDVVLTKLNLKSIS